MMWRVFLSLMLMASILNVSADPQGAVRSPRCTSAANKERLSINNEAQCAPKPVLVTFPRLTHESISPASAWVNRCLGHCESSGGDCVVKEIVTRQIAVRIYSLKTNKEACATIPVHEHLSCACTAPPDK